MIDRYVNSLTTSSKQRFEIIDDLWLKDDKDLLFIASIIRLILDERDVSYISRNSEDKER